LAQEVLVRKPSYVFLDAFTDDPTGLTGAVIFSEWGHSRRLQVCEAPTLDWIGALGMIGARLGWKRDGLRWWVVIGQAALAKPTEADEVVSVVKLVDEAFGHLE
jgi:hypothetical protein